MRYDPIFDTLPLTEWSFYFAPEGRKVDTIKAETLKTAKSEFYKRNPQYRAAKGEIYYEVSRPVDPHYQF